MRAHLLASSRPPMLHPAKSVFPIVAGKRGRFHPFAASKNAHRPEFRNAGHGALGRHLGPDVKISEARSSNGYALIHM